MKIQIDSHALQRAEERGTDKEEIKDVIRTGFSIPAKYGRLGKPKFMISRRNVSINTLIEKEWRYFTP